MIRVYPGHSFAIMLPMIVEESFNYLHSLIYDLVEHAWPWFYKSA